MKKVKNFRAAMSSFRFEQRSKDERVNRRYTFRLYPNKTQEKALLDMFGFHQRLYNEVLRESDEIWRWALQKAKREGGACVDFRADLADQRKQLNKRASAIMKAELEAKTGRKFLSAQMTSTRLTPAVKGLRDFDLYNADSRFLTIDRVYKSIEKVIKERMAGKRAFSRYHSFRSFPSVQFRRKSGWVFDGEHFAVVSGSEYLVTPMKVRGRFPGRVNILDGVAIARRAGGGWELSFCVDLLDNETVFRRGNEHLRSDSVVGIDRGVAVPMMTSEGDEYYLPENLKAIDEKVLKAQRELSLCRKGSNNFKRRVARLAKLKAKQARIRADWQHRASTDIARKNEIVILEDLKTSNMMRSAKGSAEAPGKNVAAKAGLNRSIANVGWYALERHIENKVVTRGGSVEFVSAANTSRRCNSCGHISQDNRKKQAEFSCVSCGHEVNADLNAARNIRDRAFEIAEAA